MQVRFQRKVVVFSYDYMLPFPLKVKKKALHFH